MEQLAWTRITTGQLWRYHETIETRIPFHSLAFFLSFFFFIFKRKRYSYVISAREKRRSVSSTRVHPRPPFPSSMPLQSPLNPSSSWKRCWKERNCNPGPRIHGLPVSSAMLCSTADTLYRAYANIFALNDASNPRRAAPLTRINERYSSRRNGRFERICLVRIYLTIVIYQNYFDSPESLDILE